MGDHSSVVEAFSVLGLEPDATLEAVKATYKQIALPTHPDKNQDNPSATKEFQRVSDAYNVLVKQFNARHQSRPRRVMHTIHSLTMNKGYYFHDNYDDDCEDDDLHFYMWLFEELLANRTYFGSGHDPHRLSRREIYQTSEEYQDQLRRSREEHIAARERIKQETIARKERATRERKQERLLAEERQQAKVEAKKAQAEASRKLSKERAQAILQKAQETRTLVFAAARKGQAHKVTKGIWEQGVDVTGGEIRDGCAQFVENKPDDLQETLLHIAVTHGNLDLVTWLDSHSADPEERNSQGLTVFHLALKKGHLSIVNHFLENYPPEDLDSKSIYDCSGCFNLLALALESNEPELV